MAWLDAAELSTKAVFETGPRPNGVAIVARRKLGIAACIGNETRGPELHALELSRKTAHRGAIVLSGA
jgi:hypothetical protein